MIPGMGPTTTTRNDPRWTGSATLVVASALGLVSGCGSTTSLDLGSPPSTGTSTTDAPSTGAPTSADDPTTTGSNTPSDVPDLPDLPDLPPPGSCPAACEVELPLVWSWEDAPLLEPPPDPRDPTHDAQGRRLSAMTWAPDGTLMVADLRHGEPWLTHLTHDGALVWSQPFDFFECDCEIIEVGFSPGGQLVVLGEGRSDWGAPWFELSGHFLFLDDINPVWSQGNPLYSSSPERPARVGSLMTLTNESIAMLVVETGLDGDVLEKDWFEVRYYSGGAPKNLWQLDTQLATAPPRRPRGVLLPGDELAIAVQGGESSGDYVVWARAPFDVAAASEPVGPVDAMAAGPEASVVTVGIDRTAPRGPVLHVARLPHEQPPAWAETLDVPAPGAGAPALAVDGAGSAYVALRTTIDASDDAALMLMRFAPDGTPVWTTSLSLSVSEAPITVALSLAPDDDQDLVLGAIVDGRLHLERREQDCRCD